MEALRAPRPAAIMCAFWPLIASTLISVAGGLLSLTDHAYTEHMARQIQIQNMDPAQEQTITRAVSASTIVVGLVVTVVMWVLLAFKVRAGRNWARDLVMVFWLLGAVSLWAFFSLYPTVVYQILAVVPSLLILAAIVAMFRPQARVVFRGGK